MKLGYYVKRTDTGHVGYYPTWNHPRTDGMALIFWSRESGDASLINVEYLTDWLAPVTDHTVTVQPGRGLGGRATGYHAHQCKCGWRSVAHAGDSGEGCKHDTCPRARQSVAA